MHSPNAFPPIATRHVAVCLIVVAALALFAQPLAARSTPPGARYLERELKEFKRLVEGLKRDERQARSQRKRLEQIRDRARRYIQGSSHPLSVAGFKALSKEIVSSPNQASMLLMEAPYAPPTDFHPAPQGDFQGGTVADLVQFVIKEHVAPKPGTKAQLILAELSRDALNELDYKIANVQEHIDRYKAQSAAHNSAIKELLIARAHVYHCSHCAHHGCGACGYRPSTFNFSPGEQPAGLQSQAYAPRAIASAELAADEGRPHTSGDRLPFLVHPLEIRDRGPLAQANPKR